MMKLLVVLMTVFTSYTAFARELNFPALEKAISQKLETQVKIHGIGPSFNPVDAFFNILDNNKIRRIKFTAKGEKIKCDFISYDYTHRARIENCNSEMSISSTSFEVENMFTCRNKAVIDGKKIRSAFDLHNAFITQLCFPAYYGSNLDALYDTLVSIQKTTLIKIVNTSQLEKVLRKEKYESLMLLLKEATEVNPLLSVEIKN